ncbi:MAG: hypothetical protein COV74_00590 [Candidatus Omnitrophica bacterium CG11_big_fil_rev_8_21_14_0_20_45_26]|uniref:Uncharacterized protein n=1 Tax=Candidatus Abzuiibacterium crystallinum TaxID=1974748 RepID=A0A2H0LSU7_9BACT|nr:MAG: hypothetical protein COV74_00590 [Candidatus Omnitrophica bacterium CG11_big_fil_rev_8_21_14_0_20_45_26]PIW63385.1 MAG: hypothetical protein COW12_10670 [Candidatus Omnitrophica bacterium CG12_big_fil_rev_8_21_14_0_65_45_16]
MGYSEFCVLLNQRAKDKPFCEKNIPYFSQKLFERISHQIDEKFWLTIPSLILRNVSAILTFTLMMMKILNVCRVHIT